MANLSSKGSIGVHSRDLVYVLMDDRAAFDAIALPVTEGECLSKTLDQGAVWVIFQYWGEGGH